MLNEMKSHLSKCIHRSVKSNCQRLSPHFGPLFCCLSYLFFVFNQKWDGCVRQWSKTLFSVFWHWFGVHCSGQQNTHTWKLFTYKEPCVKLHLAMFSSMSNGGFSLFISRWLSLLPSILWFNFSHPTNLINNHLSRLA